MNVSTMSYIDLKSRFFLFYSKMNIAVMYLGVVRPKMACFSKRRRYTNIDKRNKSVNYSIGYTTNRTWVYSLMAEYDHQNT